MSTELPRFPTLKGNPELVAMNQWLERLLLVVREAQVEVAKIVQYHSKLGGLTEDDHLQYLRTDGTRGLTGNWDAGLYKISSLIMEVKALTGEAPFIVGSTTQVDNLNVEYLQGMTPADIVGDYVPYTGATADVDLGVYDLTASSLIETTPTLVKLDQTTPQTMAGLADGFLNLTSGVIGTDTNTYAIEEDVKKYSGFENRTDSSIAMNGNNFEITTGTNYNVYINGAGKKNVTSTLSVEITEDQNITYVYLDWDSVGSAVRINKSTSRLDIKDGSNISLAIVFKDGADYAVTDERHGYNRCLAWHNWAHNTIGAMYYSGLGGTFTNTTLSVDGGIIYDEDIRFIIATQTECRLWYRNGLSGMRTIAPSATPYRDTNADGTGILQYDNDSGILQSVGTGQYSAQWVYASNDATYPIYVVIGQTVGNLAQIRNSSPPVINLSTAEWKLLYRVIYRNASSTVTWIETADFRSVQTGVPTNFNPTNHSSLTGRDAVDSHPMSAITDLDITLSGYVPYTGATGNVDLGAFIISGANLSGTNTGDQDLSSYLQDITGESITDLSDIPVPTDTGFLKYDGLLSVYKWEMVSGSSGLYGEVDGGVASSVYTLDQNIDGGTA